MNKKLQWTHAEYGAVRLTLIRSSVTHLYHVLLVFWCKIWWHYEEVKRRLGYQPWRVIQRALHFIPKHVSFSTRFELNSFLKEIPKPDAITAHINNCSRKCLGNKYSLMLHVVRCIIHGFSRPHNGQYMYVRMYRHVCQFSQHVHFAMSNSRLW